MHKLAEKMADCLKAKVDGMGIDNIEGVALEELGKWVDIIKDIACYDKDMRIIKAMDESEENEEKMKYIEEYEDYPERRYYDNYRYKTSGRFAQKGKGSYMPRRGYEEPPYYHIAPDMYRDYEPEHLRDIDYGSGRMYYTEKPEHIIDDTKNGNMSKYDRAKRGYEEAKNMNDTSADGKRKSMENLESYMKELSEDMTQFIGKMDANEKAMVKSKLQNLMTKF